jgi:hypothetical protein
MFSYHAIYFLVYSVCLLELVQVCCAGADAYYWFCSGFGNLEHFNTTYISPFDTPMIGAVVAFIVQLFYCHRIWKLRTNRWHILTCVVIAVVRGNSGRRTVASLRKGVDSAVGWWHRGRRERESSRVLGREHTFTQAVRDISTNIFRHYLLNLHSRVCASFTEMLQF